MSAKSSTIVGSVFWASGGTVDTSVLGTDFFGSGGSNPLSPTKFGYVACYVTATLVTLKRKGVLVVLSFVRHVSLRNQYGNM